MGRLRSCIPLFRYLAAGQQHGDNGFNVSRQHSQNRDGRTIQLKLDELIRSTKSASSRLIDLEHCTEQEFDALRAAMKQFSGITLPVTIKPIASSKSARVPYAGPIVKVIDGSSMANNRNALPPSVGDEVLKRWSRGLTVAALILLFLYLGQSFLKPLVFASLLSFILAPIINSLRRWGLWKAPAVLITVFAALALIAFLGTTLARQVTDLASELPRYETTLQDKAKQLSSSSLTSNAFKNASNKLEELGDEIVKHNAAAVNKPMQVEILQPEPKGLQSLALVVRPLISPLTTTGLIIVFLFFILFGREDLRDRLVRLAGKSDLPRTTMAFDDAGSRLSGYFLMQAVVNFGFGLAIGLGLTAIGIPHAALWGIMSGLLRYVPFLGTLISATFPTLLAAAVDPGWTSLIATVSLYVLCELLARQILEPRLYGRHTGLSPIATAVSSLLWTLLWGPIGLLLATPLTVCLVVFGRHIDAMNFIEILLGDVPALEPEERFYQRLLAGDVAEATDIAEDAEEGRPITDFYDSIAMKALSLAQDDVTDGKLSTDNQRELVDTVIEFVAEVDDLPAIEQPINDEASETLEGEATQQKSICKSDWLVDPQIVCIGGGGPIDYAGALFLTHVLQGEKFKAQERRQLTSSINDLSGTKILCVVHLASGFNDIRIRNIVRRIRRRSLNTKILLCAWGIDEKKANVELRSQLSCDFIVRSLADVVKVCKGEGFEVEALTPAIVVAD
jgi:predicted PurR-regulated permease PerM